MSTLTSLVMLPGPRGRLPFSIATAFSPENGETVVQLDAEVELGGTAALVGPLARRFVKRVVDEILATPKRTLEERSVTA
jgi:carbon monoxide dehydrogenase subunit G